MSAFAKPFVGRRALAAALCAVLASPVSPVWAQGSVHSVAAQAAPSQSYNRWANDYGVYTIPARSYLHVLPSGSLQRVEFLDTGLVVETLSSDLSSVSQSVVVPQSSYFPTGVTSLNDLYWGGFFSGASYNFVVTGQANADESPTRAVFRISKYDKEWKFLGSTELRGENTTVPFDAGSCAMAETDGKLYVRTCHEMYRSEDGYNHQANVHIVLNESDLSQVACETFVMNQLQTNGGYVSHSFNQKLAVGKDAVFGLDHGDAYPRAITVKRLDDTTRASVGNLVTFEGDLGFNATGASVGGFEYSAATDNLLAVGNLSDDYASSWSESPRSVWLTVTPATNLSGTATKTVASGFAIGTSATTPQLVKVNDNRFLVLWGVDNSSADEGRYSGGVNYQFFDGSGKALGAVMHVDGELSDCQPVVWNNTVVWYATGRRGERWVEIGGEQWLVENDEIPTAPRFFRLDAQTGVELESSTPDEPETPGTPDEPETPTTPDEPASPTTPDVPDTPATPAQPATEHPYPTLADPSSGDLAYWFPEGRDYWVDLGDGTPEGSHWYVYRGGELRRNCWADYLGRGDWYWLGADGEMFTGFHDLQFFGRTDTYYFNGKHDGRYGRMLKGEQQINGSWYYFNKDGEYPAGAMVKNAWRSGSYYGSDGRWLQ